MDKWNDFLENPSSIIFSKKLIRMKEDVDTEYIASIAERTEGFSARELEKFVIACHDVAFS